MRTFEYRGYDRQGRAMRGLIEAAGLKEAREALAGRGVLAERMKAVEAGRRKMTVAQRAVLYQELAVLLAAGLPLVRALEVLLESSEMRRHRAVVAGVRDRVREGAPLARALADAGVTVGAFETAVVGAGEAAAALPVMLERLASFLNGQERTAQRIQSALIYPLIVACAAVCVAVIMLGVLIPRAQAIWAGSQAAVPLVTKLMLGLGYYGLYGVPLLVVVGGVVVVLLRRRLRKDAALRLRLDRWRYRLPVWGRGAELLAVQRFARTMAILLEAGVGLLDGLRLAARATGSAWIIALTDAETRQIEQGGGLSASVARIPPLADALSGWIRIGEESGEISRLLEMAGKRHEELWDRFVMRRLAMLEPILILIIGIFVLLVTLAVLLPILGMTQAL